MDLLADEKQTEKAKTVVTFATCITMVNCKNSPQKVSTTSQLVCITTFRL